MPVSALPSHQEEDAGTRDRWTVLLRMGGDGKKTRAGLVLLDFFPIRKGRTAWNFQSRGGSETIKEGHDGGLYTYTWGGASLPSFTRLGLKGTQYSS